MVVDIYRRWPKQLDWVMMPQMAVVSCWLESYPGLIQNCNMIRIAMSDNMLLKMLKSSYLDVYILPSRRWKFIKILSMATSDSNWIDDGVRVGCKGPGRIQWFRQPYCRGPSPIRAKFQRRKRGFISCVQIPHPRGPCLLGFRGICNDYWDYELTHQHRTGHAISMQNLKRTPLMVCNKSPRGSRTMTYLVNGNNKRSISWPGMEPFWVSSLIREFKNHTFMIIARKLVQSYKHLPSFGRGWIGSNSKKKIFTNHNTCRGFSNSLSKLYLCKVESVQSDLLWTLLDMRVQLVRT